MNKLDQLDKWQRRMLQVAELVSSWSKDPENKVGAVLTTFDNHIISTGFNGYPAGLNHTDASVKEKLFKTIHAEVNCILHAPSIPFGTVMYITRHPCAQCAAIIVQAQVTRVVCPKPEYDSSWSESMQVASDLMFDAHVGLVLI